MTARPRVAIAGGGFAGLETAFTLRQRLGDQVDLTVISDHTQFLFKPNTIYLPFGYDERRLHIPLARPAARRLVQFHHGVVTGMQQDRVELKDGARIPYDFLVLGTGAAMRPTEVPGLAEHAETIWTPAAMHQLGDRLGELRSAAARGEHRRVLFLVPPGNKCAGPLYEIVFMLDTWLRRHGIRDRVTLTWTTYENSYIQAFGPRLHEVVRTEFADRGIEGHTGAVVSKVSADEVLYDDGSRRGCDLLVAFPPYVAAVEYPGVPADDRGFLRTEAASRLVAGTDNVYAPGDAGDFPVKQAFLALLQADAVADHIASRIDPRLAVETRDFEPTSMCVMEMFDTATFAQVPLATTGDPAGPVRVADDAGSRYRVGVSPVWQLGKKTLGLYLPWQFKAGRPFHGGRAWSAMELALRGMSAALASGPDTPRT
ncbi:MAG TPA: FAD-dependent oxidoreductase [Kribbellaceae bacterium]|nr:FAD-dependent oxidoreductase [Kribbellaceae bacterium]